MLCWKTGLVSIAPCPGPPSVTVTTGELGSISLTTWDSGLPLPANSMERDTATSASPMQLMVVK